MILLPESETVEYKSTWTDASLHTLAAFANHQGGALYIGVEDNGNVVGYTWTDDEQQRIVNQVTALGLRPEVQWETHGGKPVLCIRIYPGTMPVACRGRYFTRVGSSTREMTADQLARRVLEKLGQTWDNLPSGIDPGDSDPEAVRHFIRLARGRLPSVSAEETPKRLLENLHLLRNGVLTNTGTLLFTPQPQRLFPSAQVHIGRFQGGQVRDDRTVSGTLWSQLDGILEALRGLLHIRFETRPHTASVEGMQRQEI